MGQDVDVRHELVRHRLTMLEDLVSVLDRHLPSLNTVIDRQSSAMWTTIPACSGFAAGYAVKLAAVQRGLLAARWELVRLQEVLAASAESLARTDQDIQDRLTALADRLARVPTTKDVELLGPPTSAPTSTPTSTSTDPGGTW